MSNNSKQSIQIVGPFASNYSLSKVNRELAEALHRTSEEYDVQLWADKSQVDKMPDKNDFKKFPILEKLYSENRGKPEFQIYNNFPKSFPKSMGFDALNAGIKTAYLAWEESVFPHNLAVEINESLHGLMVTSSHVQRLMRDSGVTIPIANVGEGLNQQVTKPEKYKLKTKKSYKFLHISSGIPRKALDVLIKAYIEEFDRSDDVVLIIKTYHNEENQIPMLMNSYYTKNSPEIEVVYDLDLTDGQIADLYRQSDAVVIPSRAEGFGLPIAEAMLNKKPVITTGYGGQMDFIDETNAFVLDFEMVKANSQLNIQGSTWAEPDLDELKRHLRYLFNNAKNVEVVRKIDRAYNRAIELKWADTATKIIGFLEDLAKIKKLKESKLAVLTTYNSVCGIAEYSKDLYENIEGSFEEVRYFANSDADIVFEDPANLVRTWEYSERTFENTIEAINSFNPDIIHIQYNAPFYSLDSLSKFISETKKSGRKFYLTIHSLPEGDYRKYKDVLTPIDSIIVHSDKDFAKLSKVGFENLVKFIHGVKEFPGRSKERLRKRLHIKGEPVFASHGLIHQNKGLMEILETVKLLVRDLPEVKFISVNAVNGENGTSASTFAQMKKYIEKEGLQDAVTLIPEFLEKSEIIALLQTADILLLPYGELNEGASGAVRTCLSSSRPVIITKSAIFEDLGEVGYRIENNSPENIKRAVVELYQDKEAYYNQQQIAKEFIHKFSWEKQSLNYLLLLCK